MRRLLPVLLAAALLLPQGATAKKPGKADEKAIVAVQEQYMAAMRAGDWAVTAEVMHPDALARFREMLAPLLQMAATNGESMPGLGDDPAATLAGMDDAAFYAWFLGMLTGMQPGLAEAMAGAGTDVKGVLFDSEEAFLVYEMSVGMEGISVDKLAVTPFVRTEDGWGMKLTGEMEGIAQAMSAAMAGAGAE